MDGRLNEGASLVAEGTMFFKGSDGGQSATSEDDGHSRGGASVLIFDEEGNCRFGVDGF